jgi:beta-glucosidase
MTDYDLRRDRTDLYATKRPLYTFGFGLSYTTFRYANLHATRTLTRVTATADVTNIVSRPGDSVQSTVDAFVNGYDASNENSWSPVP